MFDLKRSLKTATFASVVLLIGVVALATSATTSSPKASLVSAIITDRTAVALSPTVPVTSAVASVEPTAVPTTVPPVASAPHVAAPIAGARARTSATRRSTRPGSNATVRPSKPAAVAAKPVAVPVKTPAKASNHDISGGSREVVKPTVRDEDHRRPDDEHRNDESFNWPTRLISLGD